MKTAESLQEERDRALERDRADDFIFSGGDFSVPADTVYLDGNSLGLMCVQSENTLNRVVDEWKQKGIKGWLGGSPPWFHMAERLGSMGAPLVGAEEDEVVVTGTTTVNIHSLVGTFFNPAGPRNKILADELNFPSDIYALRGQLKLKGLDPDDHLMMVSSADGYTLDERDIIRMMTEEVALILLPSVLFGSGQLLDMPLLTSEAHKRGIPIGFDCSHSVGAVPHQLSLWGVDFALWCSYKYLNGGPGAPAFIYVNRRHFSREPLLAGWFGYNKKKQFDMRLDFEHQRDAGGFQISSPGILGGAVLEGSLDVINRAGIRKIREKSLRLTSYLIHLVDTFLTGDPYGFSVVTPREKNRRGGHISISRKEESYRICQAMLQRGIVPDFRLPDMIRLAPVAFYNTYHDIWKAVSVIRDIVDTGAFESFSRVRDSIT